MDELRKLDRREFLRFAGGGAVTLLTGGLKPFLESGTVLGPGSPAPATAAGRALTGTRTFVPDVEIALRATQTEVPIFPGQPTRVWTYQGEVLQGDPATLQTLESTYLGPIIRVRKRQKIRVHFTNNLPEQSIVHWHGLHVPAEMDGHPRHVIDSRQTYAYEFEVRDRAGTYWYHPHPHRRTGPQVYYGLAGLFLVSDAEEAAVGLPSGEYDIPLVLQDRIFDARNQLVYQSNGMMGGMMGGMTGFLGDRILVNGQPDYTLSVATRAYRLRLLNGSNSRIYKLAWEDGTPLTVIGTDGGLLEAPVQRNYVTLAPGERVDLWVDFSERQVGTEMVLWSLPFADGMMGGGMMGGRRMGGRRALPNGAPFRMLKVRVERQGPEHPLRSQVFLPAVLRGSTTGIRIRNTLPLPGRLSTVERYLLEETLNADAPRTFRLYMQHMTWTINGRVFEMEGVASDEMVQLDTLEVWEFINEAASGGMGMGGMMAHPMHVHGLQFQVVERQVDPAFAPGWETVRAGYVDEGWKDTVLVMPGERVKVLLKFEDYTGLFLYHCHNLEHEDMGMMRNYEVV